MIVYIFIFFINSIFARPERPSIQPGEVRNWKGQRHFSYDNSNLKTSALSNKEPRLKYNIDIVEGYHSLDEEETIERVECGIDSLDIFATTDELSRWKIGDLISGSEMWQCQYTISRKIVAIEYDGIEDKFHHYFIMTVDADYTEFFENANIEYHYPSDRSRGVTDYTLHENELKQTMKQTDLKTNSKNYKVKLITPTKETQVDQNTNLIIEYEIENCNRKTCGSITTSVEVRLKDNRMNGVADSDVSTCECEDTNCHCSTTLEFKQTYQPYQQVQLKMKFTSSKGKKIPYFESEFFEINTYRLIFSSPTLSSVYNLGDNITIGWEPTKTLSEAASTFTLSIYRRKGVDSEEFIDSFDLPLKDKKFNLILNDKIYNKGDILFTRTTIKLFDREETIDGASFSILSEESILITSPDMTTYYSLNQETIFVTWDYSSTPSFENVTLTLCRRRALKKSQRIISQTTKVINNQTSLHFPLGLKISSKYYIEMTFNRYEDPKQQQTILSDSFSIGVERSFEVISELDKNQKTVTVHYTPKVNVGTFYISLYSKFPLISALDFLVSGTSEEKVKKYDLLKTTSHIFKYKEGSFFKNYVEIRYNCKLSKYFCTEERYWLEEDIPFEKQINWNFNENSQIAEKEEMNLLSFKCEDGKGKGDFKDKLSYICPNTTGVSYSLTSKCENCYLNIPISLRGFEIEIDNFEVYKTRGYFSLETKLSFSFVNIIQGQFKIDDVIPICDEMKFDQDIPIGPLILSIGLRLYPKFGLKMNFVAMFSTTISFYKYIHYSLVVDSLNEKNPIRSEWIDYTEGEKPETTIDGSIDAFVESRLHTNFKFLIGMNRVYPIHFNFNAIFGLDLKTMVSYPPFKAEKPWLDKSHLMRLEFGPFLNIELGIKDKILSTIPVVKQKYIFKKGLIPMELETQKFSIAIENVTFTNLELVTLQNEIGQITRLFYSNYNPLDIYLEKEETRSNYYRVIFTDVNIPSKIVREIKEFILNVDYSLLPEDSLRYLYDLLDKNLINKCPLPYCEQCSLDEINCEVCENGYELNKQNMCTVKGVTCDPPQVYDNGMCQSCPEGSIYDHITNNCQPCPLGSFYQNDSCIICIYPEYYDNELKRCITCSESEVLSNEGCINCEPPQIQNGSTCVYCQYPLGYLNGICQECQEPYHWEDNECVQCGENMYYYPINDSCIICNEGYIRNNFECIFCEPDQEFINGKCSHCSEGFGFNSSTQKCEKCLDNYYSENGYCYYCDGIVENNVCSQCSELNMVVNENHTKCINCREYNDGTGFYKGECIYCEEGQMININGICEPCYGETINIQGKCVKCPSNSKYDKYYQWCWCNENNKWFDGVDCVDSSYLNIDLYFADDKSFQCKENYGLTYIYDLWQCVKCEDFGFELNNEYCDCNAENIYYYYDKCMKCVDYTHGYVVDESSIEDNVPQLTCQCPEGTGWEYLRNTYQCINCDLYYLTKVGDYCECIEDDKIALLDNGHCVNCKETGGISTIVDGHHICTCPENKGFNSFDGQIKCVDCSEYNQVNVGGYCVCGGYNDPNAGYLESDGQCLTCEQRGGYVVKDSFGYYTCACKQGKNWDKDHVMCSSVSTIITLMTFVILLFI